MEDSTQFNLEASVRKWSDDSAAQPALTPEARNELETHLHDTVKELCALGINVEEAFWLACRRIGPPSQLGKEYAKENPSPVWRTRTLWVASAFLAAWIIQGALLGIGGLVGFYELHYPQSTGRVVSRIPQRFSKPYSADVPHSDSESNARYNSEEKARYLSGLMKNTKTDVQANLVRNGYSSDDHGGWLVSGIPIGAPWWVDGLRNGLQNSEAALVLGTCGAIILTALISRRPGATTARAWRLVFRSQGNVLLIGLLTVLAVLVLVLWSERVSQSIRIVIEPLDYTIPSARDFPRITFPLTLVAFITWLSPSTSRKRISKISWFSRLTRA